jgi:hypothetical protein
VQERLVTQADEASRRKESYMRREDRLMDEIAQHKEQLQRVLNDAGAGEPAPTMMCVCHACPHHSRIYRCVVWLCNALQRSARLAALLQQHDCSFWYTSCRLLDMIPIKQS